MVGEEFTNGRTVEETEFDENGNPVRSFTYNSLDPSSKFYTESEVDENGQVKADYDESGEHKTEYEYIPGTNVVRTQKLPNGSKFSYGHDQNDQVTAITQSTEEGEENSNQTVYTCGLATEHKSGNNVVQYEYDNKKRLTKAWLNAQGENAVPYLQQEYIQEMDGQQVNIVKVTNANGEVFYRYLDSQDRVVKVEKNGSPLLTYTYNVKGQVTAMTDGQSHTYTYDSLDRQIKHVFGSHSHETEYDDYGQTAKESLKFNNAGTASLEYTYTYKDDSTRALSGMSAGSFAESYKTDNLGRSKKITQTLGSKTYGKRYGYYKNGDHATNRVNAISYLKDGKTDGKILYTYDSMGNVISVNVNGKQIERFSYDKLGRIIFEESIDKGRKICYTYDENGNILTKSVNGEVTGYKYQEGTDRLLSFGNEGFAYDAMGNPTTYRGMTCTWEKGRQLKSIASTGGTATYSYDGNGLRTSKTVGSETTSFVYENGKLLRQTGTKTLDFIYGSEGVIGFKVGTASYLYRKNLFGDVTEIYNEAGTLVGKYSYTAFGVCSVDLDTNGIATDNPIRYRSYYYDDETELYYLKSRYYDPEVGRFITIDDISFLAPNIINGLNLYAYCGNNPVMNVDPNGQFFGIIIGLIAAALFLLTGCSISSAKETGMQIVANVQNASNVKDAVEAVQSVVNFVNVLSDEEQLHFMHTINVLGYAYYRHAFPVVYVSAFGGVPSNYTNRLENDFLLMRLILQDVDGMNIDELRKTPEGVMEISRKFDRWALTSYFQMGSEIVNKALKYATDIYFYYMNQVPGWGIIP